MRFIVDKIRVSIEDKRLYMEVYVVDYTIDEIKNILTSKKSQICNLGISYTVLTVIQNLLDYQIPEKSFAKGNT